MVVKLYRFFTYLISPFLSLYLAKRQRVGKEDPERMSERFGHAGFPRPEGILIWFHAASVGESMSILALLNKMSATYPDVNILLTTGTVTSAKMVESRLPDRAFHQYVPIDSIIAVRRFLKHWKPNLAVWVESEFWPNLILETRQHCPMVLLNARISQPSFDKWQRCKSISSRILQCFDVALPQSNKDGERLQALGAKHITQIGNLKFDAPILPADSKEMSKLIQMIGERHVWLAASTHEGEEEKLVDVHKTLKEGQHPDLLTIIVPRHPKRGKAIASIFQKHELNVSIRSKDQPVTDETDIYVANTMGELGIFYRLVPVVLMGGSLIPHGGQNPLEPARLECAIILGPHMENFLEITGELEENNACLRISNTEELTETINDLLHDHDRQESFSTAALKTMEAKAGVVDDTLKKIMSLLPSHIQNVNPPPPDDQAA